MSSRIRQSAYKKSLVSEQDCLLWSQQFFASLGPVIENLEQKNQGDVNIKAQIEAEFAAQYVLAGIQLLRPKDWRGGAHHGFDFTLTSSPSINIFLNHSLRSIPISVNRSLYFWQSGSYPLKLYRDIPSPLEVLKMQTRGYRCVSCITDPKLIEQYILGERDALSFALHDLIHADHFFRHPDWMKAQVGFCRWMLELYQNSVFKQWLNQDSVFEKEFFYAASDMNSHPAHLVKYFKSVLTAAILRSFQQDPRDKLSEAQKNSLQDWLFETAHIGGFDQNFYHSLLDLNSSAEDIPCLQQLTQGLENKFSLESTAASDDNKDGCVPLVEGSSIWSSAGTVVSDRLHSHAQG